MMRLTLYTTLGCHLCEQLEAQLVHLANEVPVLDRVEIADDDALLERYGVRIPVLVDAAGEALNRGFEAPRLAAWLAARGWLDEAAWQQLQRELAGEPSRPARGAVIRGGRRYLG
ncbi:glutaredoxin family protein [Halomonas sp. M4R5S39]|uniref:glutaredoxin family protein n=1 Tax=Halomonas kalidii TaxID=3043293 RepID=UPI0024A90061|nr:glutaredoxin family protein [Halomonas kalidii]MDI5987004.1 glutaredoxin family protein [Halomonas kalidii]